MIRRLLLVCFALLLLPSSALAAGNEPGWVAKPSSQTAAFQPDMKPFDVPGYQERIQMACIDGSGRPLSADQKLLLSQIALAAADVYQGDFVFGGGSALVPSGNNIPPPENGGYSAGREGMDRFLAQEQALLRSGEWVPYSSRALAIKDGEKKSGKTYDTGSLGWEVYLGSALSTISSTEGAALAPLFDADAAHYLLVTAPLPESCGLMQAAPTKPTLQTQLQEPGDFLLDQLLYVPGKIAGETMAFLQPHAWNYTFFTPHSERGDMMWSVPAACSEASTQFLSASEIAAGCSRGKPQGWSESTAAKTSSTPWFIGAARFLQWLIAGAYLLIICASAVVFIIRGNRDSSANIVRLVPRILLSAVVTILAGAAISALVSISNLFVSAIFSFSSTPTVGGLSAILLQAQALVGGSDLIGRIVSIGVALSSAFFYLVFVVSSLARQIILVACVILAPLAAMCLIVPKWRSGLFIYARLLSLALLLPVVLALILKIGVAINPLITRPLEAAGTAEGVLGLMLAIVTMWLMYRAIRLSLDVAKGGWAALAPAGTTLAALGPGSSLEKAIKSQGESISAALLPESREATAGSSGGFDLQPLPPADSAATLPPGGPSADKAQPSSGRISKFIQKRARGGSRRISIDDARKYRTALLQHLQEVQQKAGGKLSKSQLRHEKEAWEKSNGGKLQQRKGSWHLDK